MSDVIVFVEGKDDEVVLSVLVERRLPEFRPRLEFKAPTKPGAEGSGAERTLSSFELALDQAEPRAHAVAIVLDANQRPASTWERVKARLERGGIKDLPEHFPAEGFFTVNAIGKAVGCWLMPDSTNAGSLEGLLWQAVDSPAQQSLQRQAITYVENVEPKYYRSQTEPTNAVQKANLAAWLAVQERPGTLSGHALRSGVISPNAECFTPFLNWLHRLCDQSDNPTEN
jgi:hypothetical protein